MKAAAVVSHFFDHLFHSGGAEASSSTSVACSADGAPPMPTVQPVTFRPRAHGGRVLSFTQQGVERYACLNLDAPRAAVPLAQPV